MKRLKHTVHTTSSKDADQTAQMRRLISSFDVFMLENDLFSRLVSVSLYNSHVRVNISVDRAFEITLMFVHYSVLFKPINLQS